MLLNILKLNLFKINYISSFYLIVFLFFSQFGFCQQTISISDGYKSFADKNYGICDGYKSFADENYGIVDKYISYGKNILLTDSYDCKSDCYKVIELFNGYKSFADKNYGICDGYKSFADKNYGICNGYKSFTDENFGFTDSPRNADYIIITDIDLITKIFSNHSILKTLIKNFHPSNEFTTTNKSNIPKPKHNNTKAFKSKIDEDNDDILKLDNGALVEVTFGFLGLLGFRKDCIVFKSGYGWKIWIEGKKVFSCDILKEPDYSNSIEVEEVTISKVSYDGKIISLTDGSVFEVSYQSYETTLWLGYSSALLINGFQIINLDEGSEIIDVVKIK